MNQLYETDTTALEVDHQRRLFIPTEVLKKKASLPVNPIKKETHMYNEK